MKITEFPSPQLKKAWINILDKFSKKKNLLGIDIKNEPHGSITWKEWEDTVVDIISGIEEKFEYDKLYFVEGVQNHMSGWGNDFSDISSDSILLNHSKVVFSPHVYGPSVRGKIAESQKEDKFEEWFGFLSSFSNAIVIGEFGGTYDTKKDIEWHHLLGKYMKNRKMYHNLFLLVFKSK